MHKIETTVRSTTTEYQWSAEKDEWVPVSQHVTHESTESIKNDD